MAQVVSSENLVEVMSNGGKAPEFKAPEGAKPDASPDAKSVDAKSNSVSGAEKTTLQPRDDSGKFQSPSGEKSPPEKSKDGKAAPQPAVDDDPDGENLTEHARRVIAKKHRKQKEAEEFAAEEARRAIQAERRAAELERELEETRKGSTKSGQGPAAGDSSDDEPKPEDFKTVGEYTRALTKYEVAKARREALAAGEAAKQQALQERQKAQAQEAVNAFVDRRDAYFEAHPEIEEALSKSEIDFPDAGMQYIVESEKGMELMAHVLQNPDVAERLSKLSPNRVIAELGKLEARLEDAAKPKDAPKGDPAPQNTRQVSRAPAPIQPLSGDAATVAHKDPSQMTFQELRALREAERRAGTYR
jgi:hypothetical protein